MKTVTLKQFIAFGPCWVEEDGGLARLKAIAGEKKNWSALDVLRLDEVSAEDKLWAVLREEFIDAPVLHEFACRCAENALELIEKPDPRSFAAIEAKRKWLRGEITGAELDAAVDAARDAAVAAAVAAARAAAVAAAVAAARAAARAAAVAAAWAAARAAAVDAAVDAAWAAAVDAAVDAARDGQVKLLIDMLEQAE
jgi:hypothetical protein